MTRLPSGVTLMTTGARATASRTATLDNSACGSKVQTCRGCLRAQLDTRETVSNGLKLIRIRYGLPYSELPDLRAEDLNRFLSFLLLQGARRATVIFPRAQGRRAGDGTCSLKRMCKRSRWEFAHSVASIRRNLPAGCRLHIPSSRESWEKAHFFSTPPPLSSDFLRFLRKEVRQIFPYGWDQTYGDNVFRHVPNATARLSDRRADLAWQGQWKTFLSECLNGPRMSEEPMRARYKEVMSAGKCRPLVIFDKEIDLLAPLHRTINNRLQGEAWCLFGPPTEKRVSSICEYRYQTSVDLVSASDNLSLEATEAVLGAMLSKCRYVPGGIRHLAFKSLRPLVVGLDGQEHEVTHGQMMGAYLCFPLLSLQSYLAAKWALRGSPGNILVNGDDCLTSSGEYLTVDRYPPGWVLNEKKTIRNENVAEINSTAFLRGKGKWREVRHLRRGGFLTDYKGMLHAAKACSISPQWSDAFVRSRIGKKWGFLPNQIGLHPKSYACFDRRRSMWNRHFTELPDAPGERSTCLLGVRRPLDSDERLAMVAWQYAHGREGGRKRDVWAPTVGAIRRTYRYRGAKPWRFRSYISEIRALKCTYREERKEVDMCFLPADYTSIAEDRVPRDLACFWASVSFRWAAD